MNDVIVKALAYDKSVRVYAVSTTNALNELIYQIDAILVNKKEYNESFVVSIDSVINTVLPMDKDYKTVYNVFRMIAEELELED